MRSHVVVGYEVDNFQIAESVYTTPVASAFRAINTQTGTAVLIKFPNPDVEADPILSDRFKREEEIGTSLTHPGLLKAIEGVHSRPYIVSEWFEGQLLRELLKKDKAIPSDRAVRIVLNICDVLDYVEGHGVYHRDLRPENIMVGPDDSVKLINFGAAGMVGARRITFTTVSQAVGLSDYLAPEELTSSRGDARSDIYSLGVVLFEMLMGKTPFQGSDPFERGKTHPFTLLARDSARFQELESRVSPQLRQVIFDAIQPSPGKRYANAHEMAKDLRNLGKVRVRRQEDVSPFQGRSARLLIYTGLALVPIVIFALLLFFAKR